MPDWSYSRCPLCPRDHTQVYPSGPVDADVMVIGEGPGWNEDREGLPFVDRAGEELDETYLRLAGLHRGQVFVSNAIQCRCERNGVDARPAASLLRACADNHLREEILTVNPSTIILCGASACSLVGGIDLELEHGFPRRVEACAGLYGWTGTLVPMYHPAAGLHESRFMIPLLEDWERLGLFRRGRWAPPVGNTLASSYWLLHGNEAARPAETFFRRRWWAVDTESDEDRLWSIQFSPKPGFGFMILAEDKVGIAHVREHIHQLDGIIMHNATHDLDKLDKVGIHPRGVRDTIQELYHLGNLPQGLKAAVYRVFGYRMTSYNETVLPYSLIAIEDWLSRALSVASSMREPIPHPIGPDCQTCGKKHRKDVSESKPHEAEAVLRRVMRCISDNPDYNPWLPPHWSKGEETVRLFGRSWLEQIEQEIGRLPRKSIVHVPIDEAVQYGCSDADWTGKLATWLEGERKRITEKEWKVA